MEENLSLCKLYIFNAFQGRKDELRNQNLELTTLKNQLKDKMNHLSLL